jgi:hypothetical protein
MCCCEGCNTLLHNAHVRVATYCGWQCLALTADCIQGAVMRVATHYHMVYKVYVGVVARANEHTKAFVVPVSARVSRSVARVQMSRVSYCCNG